MRNDHNQADDAKDDALAKTELYLLAESLLHFLRMLQSLNSLHQILEVTYQYGNTCIPQSRSLTICNL